MIRGFITIAVATSVLWHTVAGCCAHHAHTTICSSACTESGERCCHVETPTCCQTVDGGEHDNCCEHGHDPQLTEADVVDSFERDGEHGLPSDGPSRCTEEKCVFSAPESHASALPPLNVDDGWFVNQAAPNAGKQTTPAHDLRPFHHRARFPLGALRPHLALGVMLL